MMSWWLLRSGVPNISLWILPNDVNAVTNATEDIQAFLYVRYPLFWGKMQSFRKIDITQVS